MVLIKIYSAEAFTPKLIKLPVFIDLVRNEIAKVSGMKNSDDIVIIFLDAESSGSQQIDTKWLVELSLSAKTPGTFDQYLAKRCVKAIKKTFVRKSMFKRVPEDVIVFPPYGLSYNGELPEEKEAE